MKVWLKSWARFEVKLNKRIKDMQTIKINEYSYDIDYQALVDGLSYIDSGEKVLVITLDNINKVVTKQ